MKIKVNSKKVNGLYLGFEFENGVAEVAKEDEGRAKSIATQLGYEIIEDEKKSEPKKEAPKKNSRKKKDEEK
ncbi:hypothetical protein [Cytobacillus pseudoceanisediminis]|uniref:hypothetical protein n=1 Tax=Cytobacillus pseudoceanisediminis TaxID=3051614 RepID=UPI003CE7FB8D